MNKTNLRILVYFLIGILVGFVIARYFNHQDYVWIVTETIKECRK